MNPFIIHLAQLAAFDRLWTSLVGHVVNLPENDEVTTCKMMRDEFMSETAYSACLFKGTSFIERLFDVEFSFSKIIVAVNDTFPTPKVQEYHAKVMASIGDVSFYIRHGPLV